MRVNNRDMARTARRTKRNTRIKAQLLFVAITLFMISITSIGFLSQATDTTSAKIETSYKSIRIESGDCLWTIAEQYKLTESTSTQEFVDELMFLNNMSTHTIQTGDHIVVPYIL